MLKMALSRPQFYLLRRLERMRQITSECDVITQG
jgi:hypothetical protein